MDFIDEFIEEYKNNPCLWKADSVNFKNRSKRQEAYLRLIEVAARHGEHYNVERTKQKINNLRCAFRHQLKKYTEFKNKSEKDELYCPKRRYFESLMFLKDEENQDKKLKRDSTALSSESPKPISQSEEEKESIALDSSLYCKPESRNQNNETVANISRENVASSSKLLCLKETLIPPLEYDEERTIHITQVSADLSPSMANENLDSQLYDFDKECLTRNKKQTICRKRSSSLSSQLTNETEINSSKTLKVDFTPTDIEKLFSLACKNIRNNSDDHYTNLGKIIAYKLRTMDSTQAIFAEKIIADVLFHGQMKMLNSLNINQYLNIDCTTFGEIQTNK